MMRLLDHFPKTKYFHQVYHMASLRLRDMCVRLDLENGVLEKVKEEGVIVCMMGLVLLAFRTVCDVT